MKVPPRQLELSGKVKAKRGTYNARRFKAYKFLTCLLPNYFVRTLVFPDSVKDLLPVPRTTVDRHVGDGEVMDDLDGLQVIHTPGH